MNRKKAIIIVICSVLLFVTFGAGMKYNSRKKLDQDRKHYLNHFYFQLDTTIYLLSKVDKWEESTHYTDITVNPYRQLLSNLQEMEALNKQGAWYMGRDDDSSSLAGLSESFRLIKNSIGGGITVNNQLLCVDFLNDGKLSENEVSFLVSLKQDLESIRSSLYSEERKQENPNITFKELSKVIKIFTDKYAVHKLHNIGLRN